MQVCYSRKGGIRRGTRWLGPYHKRLFHLRIGSDGMDTSLVGLVIVNRPDTPFIPKVERRWTRKPIQRYGWQFVDSVIIRRWSFDPQVLLGAAKENNLDAWPFHDWVDK